MEDLFYLSNCRVIPTELEINTIMGTIKIKYNCQKEELNKKPEPREVPRNIKIDLRDYFIELQPNKEE